MDIAEKLKQPFDPRVLSWRVGATSRDKTKGIALAYINARDVMKRLDDVLGMENWQCKYTFQGCCELSIKIGGEWITKSNLAGETNIDGEKGQASDSFKRAAVLFGIGRYLYYLENTWVPIKQQGKSYVLVHQPNLPKWAIPKG